MRQGSGMENTPDQFQLLPGLEDVMQRKGTKDRILLLTCKRVPLNLKFFHGNVRINVVGDVPPACRNCAHILGCNSKGLLAIEQVLRRGSKECVLIWKMMSC